MQSVPFAGIDDRLDCLDRFMLLCSRGGIAVEELLARVPCSVNDGLMRIERLMRCGALAGDASQLRAGRAIETNEREECETYRPRSGIVTRPPS